MCANVNFVAYHPSSFKLHPQWTHKISSFWTNAICSIESMLWSITHFKWVVCWWFNCNSPWKDQNASLWSEDMASQYNMYNWPSHTFILTMKSQINIFLICANFKSDWTVSDNIKIHASPSTKCMLQRRLKWIKIDIITKQKAHYTWDEACKNKKTLKPRNIHICHLGYNTIHLHPYKWKTIFCYNLL